MTEPPATEVSEDPPPKKFGAFGGVFTPSLLTILGVIMFLRFSTVVGYAGLWYTLLILAAAKAISVITGLSVASIATNMRVKGGGLAFQVARNALLCLERERYHPKNWLIKEFFTSALLYPGFDEATKFHKRSSVKNQTVYGAANKRRIPWP
jgi:hypothetical protein